MKLKSFIKIILILLIVLVIVFLYLFLTRNTLLTRLPIFPQRQTAPDFQRFLEGSRLSSPVGVFVDPLDNVYVADTQNRRIVVFDNNGVQLRDFGHNYLVSPVDVAVMRGLVYVADLKGQRLQVFTADGTFRGTLAESGQDREIGEFNPTALAVDPEEGNIYFTDTAWHRVVVVDREGGLRFAFGKAGGGAGELLYPNGIALDGKKNIYVADSNNGRVLVFSPDGKKVLRQIYGGRAQEEAFSLPKQVAVDKEGNLWVVDALAHKVSVYSGERKLFAFGGLGVSPGELYFPNALAFDSAGRIYVTERGLHRVSVFAFPVNPLDTRRR